MMCAVRLGSTNGDVEHLGDLLVRVAQSEEPQDLPLPIRERVLLGGLGRRGIGCGHAGAECRVDVAPPRATSRTAETSSASAASFST